MKRERALSADSLVAGLVRGAAAPAQKKQQQQATTTRQQQNPQKLAALPARKS